MSSKRFTANGRGAARPNPALTEKLPEEGSERFGDERLERRVISYLLEELSEEESEQFEDECFAGEDWPAQVKLVEDDLVDAYLRGELSPEQRRRFEQNYLTTQARRERVRVAAALLRHVDEHRATDQAAVEWWRAFWPGQLRPLAAVLAVVVVAANLWVVTSPGAVASLTLNISNGDRAGGPAESRVKLPRGTRELKITLALPQGHAQATRYRTELSNVDGEMKPSEVAGHDARTVSVVSPAAQLPSGRYELKLFAAGPDGAERRVSGSYFFTVE